MFYEKATLKNFAKLIKLTKFSKIPTLSLELLLIKSEGTASFCKFCLQIHFNSSLKVV